MNGPIKPVVQFDFLSKGTKEERIKALFEAHQKHGDVDAYNAIIKKLEIASLCKELGVDYELEYEKYGYFIETAINARLPPNWTKELQMSKELVYFNLKDGTFTYDHPCLPTIKELMKNEFRKMTRQFGKQVAIASVDETDYTNKTEKLFEKRIMSDMTMYQIGKFMIKGEDETRITKQEHLIANLISIYQQTYGYDLDSLKRELTRMRPLKAVNHLDVSRALNILNIMPDQAFLVWIARFYVSLPLPEGWEEKDDNTQEECFMNIYTYEMIKVRPCFYYIVRLISEAKNKGDLSEKIGRTWMIDKKHVFEDTFSRPYSISNEHLFGLSDAIDSGLNIQKARDLIGNLIKKRMETIIQKKKDKELNDPFIEKVDKFIKNPDIRDEHLVFVARQVGVDPNSMEDCHLLFFISNFIVEKLRYSNWSFRFPRDSDCYWINHTYKKISSIYPFLEELKVALKEHRDRIEFRSSRATNPAAFKNLSRLKRALNIRSTEELISTIQQTRTDLVSLYNDTKITFNTELYNTLKSRLKARLSSHRTSQFFSLSSPDQASGEVSSKKYSVLPAKESFKASLFASSLLSTLSLKATRSLIFFNFFELDLMARDSLLSKGTGQVEGQVEGELLLNRRTHTNTSHSLTQTPQTLQTQLDLSAEWGDEDVMRGVRELIRKANIMQGDRLEGLIELEMKNRNIDTMGDVMKMNLDFLSRYGQAGNVLRENIIKKKWNKIRTVARNKKEIRKLQKIEAEQKLKKAKPKRKYLKKAIRRNPRNKNATSVASDRSAGSNNINEDQFSEMGDNYMQTNPSYQDLGTPLNRNDYTRRKKSSNISRTSSLLSKKNSFANDTAKAQLSRKNSFANEMAKAQLSKKNSFANDMAKAQLSKKNSFANDMAKVSRDKVNPRVIKRLERQMTQTLNSKSKLITKYSRTRSSVLDAKSSQPLFGGSPSALRDSAGSLALGGVRSVVGIAKPSMASSSSTVPHLKTQEKSSTMNPYSGNGDEIAQSQHRQPQDSFLRKGTQRNSLRSRNYNHSVRDRNNRGDDLPSIATSFYSGDDEVEDAEIELQALGFKDNLKDGLAEYANRKIGSSINTNMDFAYNKDHLLGKIRRSRRLSDIDKKHLLSKLKIESLTPRNKYSASIDTDDTRKKTYIVKELIKDIIDPMKVNSSGHQLNNKNFLIKKKPIVTTSKLYNFGSAQCVQIKQSKMLEALNEFDHLYDQIMSRDILSSHDAFDYKTLIEVLQEYIRNALSPIKQFTNIDKSSMEEILRRVKDAYFSHKLSIRYTNKSDKYYSIDIFTRLHEYEIYSLRKLFHQIKLLIVNVGSFRPSRPDIVNRGSLVHTLPKVNPINLKSLSSQEPEIARRLRGVEDKIYQYTFKKPVVKSEADEYRNNLKKEYDPHSIIKDLLHKERLKMIELIKTNNLDRTLEMIVTKALFELVDFTKIESTSKIANKPVKIPAKHAGYKFSSSIVENKKRGCFTIYEYKNNTGMTRVSSKSSAPSEFEDFLIMNSTQRKERAITQRTIILPMQFDPSRDPKIGSNVLGKRSRKIKTDTVKKGIVNSQRTLSKNYRGSFKSIKKHDFIVKGENSEKRVVEQSDSLRAFNNFRQLNRDLIQRAKLALLNALTQNSINGLLRLDKTSIDKIKGRVEKSLETFLQGEIFVRGNVNELKKIVTTNDWKNLDSKVIVSSNFRYCKNDLCIDARKVV